MDDELDRRVEAGRPVVSALARRLWRRLPRGMVDLEDLEADGLLGLVQAAQRFSDRPDVAFTTFATPRIWGAMIDGLRQLALLPRSAVAAGKRAEVVSLEAPIAGDVELSLNDVLPDVAAGARVDAAITRQAIVVALARLTERERTVVVLWDLYGFRAREIAAGFGVTESRISQIRDGAHRRLRAALARAA